MEGKLPILILFVIINNVCSYPSVLPRSSSKTNLNKSSLVKQNINRRNDDEQYVNREDNENDYENNENNYENDNAESSGLFERPLAVGDTFTPSELLPVTEKLFFRVLIPGLIGRGIVSGAKNAIDLADKLFEAFFFSRKRIVTLNEDDIIGLDALQALALSGKVTSLRDHKNIPVTEATDQATVSYRGQTISINLEPRKSKYALLTKKEDKLSSIIRRKAIKIAEKLSKNRHLIVNPGRRQHATYKFSKKAEINRTKEIKPQTGSGTKKQTPLTPGNNKTFCHWKYECTNPIELDTCQLKTECNKNTTVVESLTPGNNNTFCHSKYECTDSFELDTCQLISECNKNTTVVEFDGVPHLPDENNQSMQQFRKMLGITLIDEEVEKILEKRYLKLQPANGRPGPDIARLESLSEYFNNIIMNDFMKSTDPHNEMLIPVTEAIRDSSMEEHQKLRLGPIESERKGRFYATPTRTLKILNH